MGLAPSYKIHITVTSVPDGGAVAFTHIHVAGEDGSFRAHSVHGKFSQRQGRPLGMSLKEGAVCAACKNGLIPLSMLAQAAVPEMAIVDRSARKCPGNPATGTVGTERVVRATTLELPGAGSTTRRGPQRRRRPCPRAQALEADGNQRRAPGSAPFWPPSAECALCVLWDAIAPAPAPLHAVRPDGWHARGRQALAGLGL